jgi:ribosomal protein S27E
MNNNHRQLDEPSETIHCDQCGASIASATGRFLRPVVVLCSNCQRGTRWYPAPKGIDSSSTKGVKSNLTEN